METLEKRINQKGEELISKFKNRIKNSYLQNREAIQKRKEIAFRLAYVGAGTMAGYSLATENYESLGIAACLLFSTSISDYFDKKA